MRISTEGLAQRGTLLLRPVSLYHKLASALVKEIPVRLGRFDCLAQSLDLGA